MITLLVNAVAIFLAGYLLKGVEVKNFLHALIAALVISLLNFFVKPILEFFAFPVTFLTLGLFIWVINALILMLADWLLSGLKIKSFWWALAFAIVIAIINVVIFKIF